MKLTLKYSTSQGEHHQVTTNLWTVVAWERRYKRKASDLAQGIGAEDLAFLTYEASRQAGITVPSTLDEFINRLIDIPEVVDSEDTNPTQAEQSTDF